MTRYEQKEAIKQRFDSFVTKLLKFKSEQKDSVKFTLGECKDIFSSIRLQIHELPIWQLKWFVSVCNKFNEEMQYYLNPELYNEFKQLLRDADNLDYQIYVEYIAIGL